MKFFMCFVVILLFGALLVHEIEAAVYRTRNGAILPLHLRRLQHRSAMYGEYYQPEMMYVPGMATFTSGDTFSTGYLDPIQPQPLPQEKPCESCNSIPEESIPESDPEPDYEVTTKIHKFEIEQSPEEETSVRIATQIPIIKEATTQKTKTKITPIKPVHEEDDEEEEDYDDWPYVRNQGRKIPPYNVFFPMMFRYSGNGRSDQGFDGHPGGATAIANSFSSGKGGVATSHATAFGNAPPLNKHSNWKRRIQKDD